MINIKNKEFTGSAERKSLYDCQIDSDSRGVIIFVHGYKGFKDWGAWNLMERAFLDSGFGFVKFNMTHNGGTVDQPIDFPDLEAFGNNRYTYEVNDLDTIISEAQQILKEDIQKDIPIYLLGHSRGGGVAILQSSGDPRIEKVISLAGIADISSRFPKGAELEKWEDSGVVTVKNGRTGQDMPLYYSLYLDYAVHHIELDIEIACRSMDKPFLQIHGDNDESVDVFEGKAIAEWTQTELYEINGAGHTFGAKHTWNQDDLPEHLAKAIDVSIAFFNK